MEERRDGGGGNKGEKSSNKGTKQVGGRDGRQRDGEVRGKESTR